MGTCNSIQEGVFDGVIITSQPHRLVFERYDFTSIWLNTNLIKSIKYIDLAKDEYLMQVIEQQYLLHRAFIQIDDPNKNTCMIYTAKKSKIPFNNAKFRHAVVYYIEYEN
jgi:hypothetical protein